MKTTKITKRRSPTQNKVSIHLNAHARNTRFSCAVQSTHYIRWQMNRGILCLHARTARC